MVGTKRMVGMLHCLSHGFGVAEVVFWPSRRGPRHQLHVVSEGEELSAQMIGADARRVLLLQASLLHDERSHSTKRS